MNGAEVILTLLTLVATCGVVARRVGLPHPVLLVLGGLALGSVPGFPAVPLEPEAVFMVLLPPLLYPAAVLTSWRDFRANLTPILLLAIGLVLLTTVVVAAAVHALAGLPWAVGFVLGAIVSPPDAVAATAITSRLRVPLRVVTVLEGESLVNDATALVAYRFAIAATVGAKFSWAEGAGRFLLVACGGTAIGLAVGWLLSQAQRRLDDPPVQITLSLLAPFAAYLPAERLHTSGVLAVVACGLFVGWRLPRLLTPRARLDGYVFWGMASFLLNGLVFTLIGLQLPRILQALSGQSLSRFLWHGVLISGAAIVVRVLWVFASTHGLRLLSAALGKKDPYPSWQNVTIVAWTGMRGVVSLAAALAVPLTLSDGRPFPGRNYILFVTFCVILATLVLQGLSLPALIRSLGVRDDGLTNLEERTARLKANQAALAYLADAEANFPSNLVERLRAEYQDRIQELARTAGTGALYPGETTAPAYARLQQDALDVERQTIIGLRDAYAINDEVLRRIQHDLDHAEARLHVREGGAG